MATFTRRDLTLGAVAVVRILGIDPGTQVVGFGCLEVRLDGPVRSETAVPMALRGSNVVRAQVGPGGAVQLVAAGVLRLGDRRVALPERLRQLASQFAALLTDLAPAELALEEAFYGKSVQAALRIGEARGVVLAAAAAAGLAVHQFAPARVKRCVNGNGAAGKESVAAMVRQFVPAVAAGAPLPLDATDAVAVAWTRLEQRRSPLLALEEHLE
jgi:crossover junction endodeoxyribonuclease RuvC